MQKKSQKAKLFIVWKSLPFEEAIIQTFRKEGNKIISSLI
jgi:hypothetical protein